MGQKPAGLTRRFMVHLADATEVSDVRDSPRFKDVPAGLGACAVRQAVARSHYAAAQQQQPNDTAEVRLGTGDACGDEAVEPSLISARRCCGAGGAGGASGPAPRFAPGGGGGGTALPLGTNGLEARAVGGGGGGACACGAGGAIMVVSSSSSSFSVSFCWWALENEQTPR